MKEAKEIRLADEVMEEMLETYKQRGSVYKQNYLMLGELLEKMFPDGVNLKTAEDHNRWHLFIMAMVKITRLACTNLEHEDSALDLSVYSAMLTGLINGE